MNKIVIVGAFALGFAHRVLQPVVLCLQHERLGVTGLLTDSVLIPVDIASIQLTGDTYPSNYLLCLLVCA